MLNQERSLTLVKIIMIWFLGFACGAPFMNFLVNIKYGSSVIIPLINFLLMAIISGVGLFLLLKKKGSVE
ncbi:MAG: hypothetical protein KJ737_27685 [Proteobacteria bacterium]|nr:hypothetical protein [Pseudomonadota bacterium]